MLNQLSKKGNYQITGLDISRSFVKIARKNATEAGVKIDFREGKIDVNGIGFQVWLEKRVDTQK